jgi:hypothetical protein
LYIRFIESGEDIAGYRIFKATDFSIPRQETQRQFQPIIGYCVTLASRKT